MTLAVFMLVILPGCSSPALSMPRMCCCCGQASSATFVTATTQWASPSEPSKHLCSHPCHWESLETTRRWSSKRILPILDITMISICKTYTAWSPHKLIHSGELGTESGQQIPKVFTEFPVELTVTGSSSVLEQVCCQAGKEVPEYKHFLNFLSL